LVTPTASTRLRAPGFEEPTDGWVVALRPDLTLVGLELIEVHLTPVGLASSTLHSHLGNGSASSRVDVLDENVRARDGSPPPAIWCSLDGIVAADVAVLSCRRLLCRRRRRTCAAQPP
jgi:hypothetical protein